MQRHTLKEHLQKVILSTTLNRTGKIIFLSIKKVATTTPSAASGKCMNLEGCSMYSKSFIALEPNLNTISKVPPTTSTLILNGENDTQTPVQGALLLQQKLTEINHPDHILITYPNLGHEFYPSSEWRTEHGPIPQYVLADLYSWLESHSGFTRLPAPILSSNSTTK